MSLTKRYIGDLQDLAAKGDTVAIETLEAAGLWQSEEEYLQAEAELFNRLEMENAFADEAEESFFEKVIIDEDIPW